MQRKISSYFDAKAGSSTYEDYAQVEESSDTISASEEKQDFSIGPPYLDIDKLSTESLQKDDIKMNILSNIWDNASKV